MIATAGVSAALGPLAWNLILRHTGGDFFVDAPGYVFPVSYEDTAPASSRPPSPALRSASARSRAATGRRLAVTTATCGLAALLVDIYLY